jgi:2-oxo-4-hydroxy-4-carboxy--5-ureidoimidazoline (OHCU) decarboxylase
MIADSLQQRMTNSEEEEKHRALQEVIKIAAFRMEHLELHAS